MHKILDVTCKKCGSVDIETEHRRKNHFHYSIILLAAVCGREDEVDDPPEDSERNKEHLSRKCRNCSCGWSDPVLDSEERLHLPSKDIPDAAEIVPPGHFPGNGLSPMATEVPESSKGYFCDSGKHAAGEGCAWCDEFRRIGAELQQKIDALYLDKPNTLKTQILVLACPKCHGVDITTPTRRAKLSSPLPDIPPVSTRPSIQPRPFLTVWDCTGDPEAISQSVPSIPAQEAPSAKLLIPKSSS